MAITVRTVVDVLSVGCRAGFDQGSSRGPFHRRNCGQGILGACYARYGGATGESNGIIAIMELIKQDIEKDIAKAGRALVGLLPRATASDGPGRSDRCQLQTPFLASQPGNRALWATQRRRSGC